MTTRIHQIYLTTDNAALPDQLKAFSDTITKAFPDCDHKVWSDPELHDFIADVYGMKVLRAYKSLKPFSYKADLARFCLLNYFGGWYFDIGVRVHQGIDIGKGVDFVAFRDIQRFSLTTYACATTVLYSKPSNAILDTAIQMIVENVENRFYGITPLCPTGPTLLGKAIASVEASTAYIYGDYLELTPNHQQRNRAFVLPDGSILAWSKPAGGGDLTALGGKGVNNYNVLWNQRDVYAD